MTYSTHRGYPDDEYSEALSYDRLEEPWHQWAKIASSFIRQLDGHQDREDLMHNIIVRLAEVAEEYRQQGKPLTKGGVYTGSPVYSPPLLPPKEKVEKSILF